MGTYKGLTQEQIEERIIGHIKKLKNHIKENKNSLPRYLSSMTYSHVKGNIEKFLHYLEERGITPQNYLSTFAETIHEYRELIESSEREVYEPALQERTQEMFKRVSLERRMKYTRKQDEKLKMIFRDNARSKNTTH